MAVLPLAIIGDPVLRRPTEPVREITPDIRQLVEDMFETMHANNGIGLAANQVGVSLRIAVLGIPEKGDRIVHVVLINPVWENPRGEVAEDEGCLSVPGIYEELRRVRGEFGHVARPNPHAATFILRDLLVRTRSLSGLDRTQAIARKTIEVVP